MLWRQQDTRNHDTTTNLAPAIPDADGLSRTRQQEAIKDALFETEQAAVLNICSRNN
jgi:hypothetical protein